MEDGLWGTQSRVIWLISTAFVIIAVSYGVSLISNGSKNTSIISESNSSVLTPTTAARAAWLSGSARENSDQYETTSTGPILTEHNQDKLISDIDIWEE